MPKKYIVRLGNEERETCGQAIRKLTGTSEKVRRAQVLLKADVNGPAWTDQKIAEAFSCRTITVEKFRHSKRRRAEKLTKTLVDADAMLTYPEQAPLVRRLEPCG